MRRRGSSGSTVQEAKIGPTDALWWESRLVLYRDAVLFVWSSLRFQSSIAPGAAILLLTNTLIIVLLSVGENLLEAVGNVFLMVAILYALLCFGLRYGILTAFPEWTRDSDAQFQQICHVLSNLVRIMKVGVRNAINSRLSAPRTFYGFGFAIAIFMYYMGMWFSTAFYLYMTVTLLLLTPLWMEQSKLEDSSPKQLMHMLRHLWTSLVEQVQGIGSKLSRGTREPKAARATTTT